MATQIRILLVEDFDDDATLIVFELERAGYAPNWLRVDNAAALTAALSGTAWDVITCDWTMPGFGAPAALKIIEQHHVDTPVIVVSGEVDEDTAIRAIKLGAHEFVSKHRLARLVPAIEREILEGVERTRRRQAEAAIRRSEANLRAILNNSLQSFVLVNRDGTIRAFNQIASVRTQLLFGTRALVEGSDLFGFLPAAQRAQMRADFDRALQGEVVVSEHSFRGVDGNEHWFEINHIPIREDEAVTGVCVSALDISRHRQLEDALRSSEERLRNALQAARLVAWEWDIDRDEFFCSQPLTSDTTVFDPKTLADVLELITPGDRERVRQAVQRSIEQGGALETSFHMICQDGRTRAVADWGTGFRDISGRTVRLAGIAGRLRNNAGDQRPARRTASGSETRQTTRRR